MRIFDPVAFSFAVGIYGVFLYTFQLGETTQACIESWRGTFCYTTIATPNISQWQAVGFILSVYAVLAYISHLHQRIHALEVQNRQHRVDYTNIEHYYRNQIQILNQVISGLQHELEMTLNRLFAELGAAMDEAENRQYETIWLQDYVNYLCDYYVNDLSMALEDVTVKKHSLQVFSLILILSYVIQLIWSFFSKY